MSRPDHPLSRHVEAGIFDGVRIGLGHDSAIDPSLVRGAVTTTALIGGVGGGDDPEVLKVVTRGYR